MSADHEPNSVYDARAASQTSQRFDSWVLERLKYQLLVTELMGTAVKWGERTSLITPKDARTVSQSSQNVLTGRGFIWGCHGLETCVCWHQQSKNVPWPVRCWHARAHDAGWSHYSMDKFIMMEKFWTASYSICDVFSIRCKSGQSIEERSHKFGK